MSTTQANRALIRKMEVRPQDLRVLLLTPPMVQLNTPYPATACLTGFLRSQGYDAKQADLGLELALSICSREGLASIRDLLTLKGPRSPHPAVEFFLAECEQYLAAVDPVIHFLQGRDLTIAQRIVNRTLLPEGPAFWRLFSNPRADALLQSVFGRMGATDRAKYLATLFLTDIGTLVREGVDPRFQFSSYASKLSDSSPDFGPLRCELGAEPSWVDQRLAEIVGNLIRIHDPHVLGISVPFPGTVYSAFRIARQVKQSSPGTRIVLGGGYVNTELRSLSEPAVFDYFDYVTLDDGEAPLLCILDDVRGASSGLLRTWVRREGNVVLESSSKRHDVPQKNLPAPTYDGLTLNRYLSTIADLNPVRMFNEGHWNKLMLAHGCYWRKCSFCDTHLDYIGRYDPSPADGIIDRMEKLIAETGHTGFHFVDEAAPPALLRAIAERLIERGLAVSWWGNIRFDKVFDEELAELLARSGCIAVTGGLEVASDRLLKLMNKGVTVDQVARVTRAFADAGVIVHAYLMYAFPTQTLQETVDSLERVRQLFAAGCLHSARWHRYAATAHSPMGVDPSAFGFELDRGETAKFARYNLRYRVPGAPDWNMLGNGLEKAVLSYTNGISIENDVRTWFTASVPKPRVARNLVTRVFRAG